MGVALVAKSLNNLVPGHHHDGRLVGAEAANLGNADLP